MESFFAFAERSDALSLVSFVHLVAITFLALFPPVNPIGTALIVGPFFRGHPTNVRRNAALTIALYCLSICLIAALGGGVLFKLFGISVPVVQIAGGFLIARMGFSILSKSDMGTQDDEKMLNEGRFNPASLKSYLFYPLAFPITTGGGTISVLLALSANSYHADRTIHIFNLMATCVACILMALLIFVCYFFAPALLNKLSSRGALVVNNLSGFLTFCVGIQIVVNGLSGLRHLL